MEDKVQNLQPANRENTGRNIDGTFKPGFSGNPSGRPKGTLKDYVRRRFMEMTDEEKEDFISKLNPIDLWKMGEGNPDAKTDITSDGKQINSMTYEQALAILGRRNTSNTDTSKE